MKIFTKKRVWIGILVILAGLLIYLGVTYYPYLQQGPIGCGYKAKILCSGIFVSGRDTQSVLEQDLVFHPLFKLIKAEVDYDQKAVNTSLLGLVKARAVYIEKLGGILLSGASEESIRSWPVSIPEPQPANPEEVPWPAGDLLTESENLDEIDLSLLSKALDKAFEEPDPKKPLRTRAVAVVYKGDLIAERYAPGITKDMPLIGWSMSKSITSTLVGLRVKQGKLDIHAPAPVPEWQNPNDPRKDITLNHLRSLTRPMSPTPSLMSTPCCSPKRIWGLLQPAFRFKQSRGLFGPIPAEPQTSSPASSGILLTLTRNILPFPARLCSTKSACGTLCWNRMLQVHFPVPLTVMPLPGTGLDSVCSPAPASRKGEYGAQFWLNKGSPEDPKDRKYPKLPRDAFFCLGHNSQSVTVIPSKQLVVVRLGWTTKEQLVVVRLGWTTKGGWNLEEFIVDILNAIKPVENKL